jgi:hypothetical protein
MQVSSRAIKVIAAGSRQTRNLHMTGPATFSSLLTSERPALNLPRDLAGLRAECQKRKLPIAGSIDEVRAPLTTKYSHFLFQSIHKLTAIFNQLTSRLSAHEIANTRSFSTILRSLKRPIPDPNEVGVVRHFNTSRSLKTVKDSSTIDFAYIPDFDPDAPSAPAGLRVPILPQNTSANVADFEEGTGEVVRARSVTNPKVALLIWL